MGIIPDRLKRPTVGLMPTNPLAEEGQVIDPFVSVPIENTVRFADAAAPEPALEPQGFLVKS
jgi:hypothetical protein